MNKVQQNEEELTSFKEKVKEQSPKRPSYEEASYNRQSQIQELEKQLQEKDVFSQISDYVRLAFLLSPTVVGLLDVITDVVYVSNQHFGHHSIRELFYVFMLFAVALQFVIWTIFLTQSQLEEKEQISQPYMTQYIENLTIGKKARAYFYLTAAWAIHIIYFSIKFLLNTPKGILYALAAQLKLLPFYLSYFFAEAGKLQYTINEEFIQEYRMKEIQFKKISEIDKINKSIREKNESIRRDNSALQDWDKDRSKSLREFKPQIELTQTDPLVRAQIMKHRVYFKDKILENAYLKRFLVMGDLVQAVFESLPMLILQYVNNSLTEAWTSQIAVLSFACSFMMVFVHACNMIYKLSQSETFPLIHLLQLIREKNAYESPDWLFGITDLQTFEIQNEQELDIYSQADQDYFYDTDKIVYNVSNDEEQLRKAICGKHRVFQYLRLITAKACSQNTIILDFNDNQAVELDNVEDLLEGLKVSHVVNYTLRLNNVNLVVDNRQIDLITTSSLNHLTVELAGWNLDMVGIIDVPRTLKSIHFNFSNSVQLDKLFKILWAGIGVLTSLKYFYLNLQQYQFSNIRNTTFENLEDLCTGLFKLNLEELNLNFEQLFKINGKLHIDNEFRSAWCHNFKTNKFITSYSKILVVNPMLYQFDRY